MKEIDFSTSATECSMFTEIRSFKSNLKVVRGPALF